MKIIIKDNYPGEHKHNIHETTRLEGETRHHQALNVIEQGLENVINHNIISNFETGGNLPTRAKILSDAKYQLNHKQRLSTSLVSDIEA